MRYLCTISYDGSNYAGYQIQPNQTTIQSTIEAVLAKIHKGSHVKIQASGRTDAGVHAIGQTFHFDSNLSIEPDKWKKALNARLPDDLVVTSVKTVPDDFHARYDVTEKTYQYVILNQPDLDPFMRKYAYYVKGKLDLVSIQQACTLLIGQHDFTSFCASNSGVKGSKVREIYQASCEKHDNTLIFTFSGSGFLYNMVRILVGTLLEIGMGHRDPSDLARIIQSKQRSQAGKTAPAHGLYLKEVRY